MTSESEAGAEPVRDDTPADRPSALDATDTAPPRPGAATGRLLSKTLGAAAQRTAGRKSAKERLVRHGPLRQKDRLGLKKRLQALWRVVWAALPYLAPFIAYRLWGSPQQSFVAYLSGHLGLLLIPALPLISSFLYSSKNRARTHPHQAKGRPKVLPRPPLPPTSQHGRDINDIVANLDHLPARLVYVALFAAAVWVTGRQFPLAVPMFADLTTGTVTAETLRPLLIPLLAPVVAFAVPRLRCAHVIRKRFEEIDECYAIAREALGYKDRTGPKADARAVFESTPWLAVSVKKWWALYEIDRAFVRAPESLSVTNPKAWDEFTDNLNVKMPRPEEWRIQRDPKGRGAFIGPANYPTAILWDGDYDPDPLTFILGTNLETGETQYLTLNDTSPHLACSGGTASGKSSAAEIMAAQVLVKPMPWDSDLHGQVVIIDPKGPFARRWRGRPNVVVADGQADSAVDTDDDGNPLTGPSVMASAMDWVEAEHQRRAHVLARYPDVGTWLHLPDDVKRDERFFPILVVLDEYIDHTDIEKAGADERVARENDARQAITRLASWHARKYRNVGMHTFLIAQRVNMSIIGNVLMSNLPVRIITGQMDRSQTETMFGTSEVPTLPATRTVIENGERRVKTIPGRARIMNALGQTIHKVQVMWFGGPTNSETLDKWLPRGRVPVNGDFTPGPGKPRKPSDFDADGTLLVDDMAERLAGGPVAPAPAPPAADPDSDDVDGREPLTPETDGSAVFPAAHATLPLCVDGTCVNEAETTCPDCGEPYCPYHLKPSPDAEAKTWMCQRCIDKHPLLVSGVAEVYALLVDRAPSSGLAVRVEVQSPEAVVVTVTTSADRKVLEVRGDDGEVAVQSRSGVVTGPEAALDRAADVLDRYRERLEASAVASSEPTGGGE